MQGSRAWERPAAASKFGDADQQGGAGATVSAHPRGSPRHHPGSKRRGRSNYRREHHRADYQPELSQPEGNTRLKVSGRLPPSATDANGVE